MDNYEWIVEGWCKSCKVWLGIQHKERARAIYELANLGCPHGIGHNFKTHTAKSGGRFKFTSRKHFVSEDDLIVHG